jgi:hypothetical protein
VTRDREFLFCRDCKHIRPANFLTYWGRDRMAYARCHCPRQVSGYGLIDPSLEKGAFCAITRADETKCGASAAWFEPKGRQGE